MVSSSDNGAVSIYFLIPLMLHMYAKTARALSIEKIGGGGEGEREKERPPQPRNSLYIFL